MEFPKNEEIYNNIKNNAKFCPSKLNIKLHAENLDVFLQDSNKIYKKYDILIYFNIFMYYTIFY